MHVIVVQMKCKLRCTGHMMFCAQPTQINYRHINVNVEMHSLSALLCILYNVYNVYIEPWTWSNNHFGLSLPLVYICIYNAVSYADARQKVLLTDLFRMILKRQN